MDSLRGIAAFCVLFGHLFVAFPEASSKASPLFLESWQLWQTWLLSTPLRAFINGRPAVILFFVLSGFVLSINAGRDPYGIYVIKRVCRIYLPFVAAIIFAAILCLLSVAGPKAGLSDWFNLNSWTEPPSTGLMLRHVLMTGVAEDMKLNNVMWSLVHEVRISLVFPLIAVLTFARPRIALMAFFSIWIVAQILGRLVEQGSAMASIIDTVGYAFFFVLGAAAYGSRDVLGKLASRLKPVPIICFSIILMSVPAGAPGAELLYGAASLALLSVAVVNDSVRRTLEIRPLIWLGSGLIAYSQKMTVAARAIADRNAIEHLS